MNEQDYLCNEAIEALRKKENLEVHFRLGHRRQLAYVHEVTFTIGGSYLYGIVVCSDSGEEVFCGNVKPDAIERRSMPDNDCKAIVKLDGHEIPCTVVRSNAEADGGIRSYEVNIGGHTLAEIDASAVTIFRDLGQ